MQHTRWQMGRRAGAEPIRRAGGGTPRRRRVTLGRGPRSMHLHLFRPEGPRAGPVVLVLHGRDGSAAAAQIVAMRRAALALGLAVAVPDLRFSAANDSAGAGSGFRMGVHVADAARALDWLARPGTGLAPVPPGILVIGHSMGAYAALRLAAGRSGPGPGGLCQRGMRWAATGHGIAGVVAVSPVLSGAALIEARRAMGPAAVEALEAAVPGALADYAAHDLAPVLGRVRCPVAVMTGDRDGLTPPAVARRLAAGLKARPRQRVTVIEGAHHCPVGPRFERALCAALRGMVGG